MNLYFASTHADFFYAHYLAVISAIKTQNVDNIIMICTTPPVGYYADLICNKVIMQPFEIPDFKQFENASWEKLRTAHSKDYIQWVTLYNNGGIFIDLDTLCIRDMSNLLGSFDVIATPRFLPGFNVSYESAVVIAKKNSIVVADTLKYALQALNSNVDKYQTTGPIAYTRAINNHKNIVGFPGYDVLSPRIIPIARTGLLGYKISQGYVPTWEELPIPNGCCILHIYASTSDLTRIDKDWVASSNTMYASAVKQVLKEDEWYL